MGVQGLWRLIEASGKPVPLESLENKVLAVDVSIWLHQAIKGFQDSKGGPLPNAHLLGIYHRLCKLLYFKIKPVFVFDGGVPALKKQAIAKRNQQKARNVTEADRIHKNLLSTLLKHSAISKVLSEKTKAVIASTSSPTKKTRFDADDLYALPQVPQNTMSSGDDEELAAAAEDTTISDIDDDDDGQSSSTDCTKHHQWDLHSIDTKSAQFRSLPVDVRHDILTDLKETRKQSSWGRINQLPTQSDDFSVYQMKRLLKRQTVQSALEQVEKEMGGNSLSLGELEQLLKDQGVITSTNNIVGNRIASDENTRFLLIKDVKQAIEEAKHKLQEEPPPPSSSPPQQLEEGISKAEFEDDFAKAIALSLQDGGEKESDKVEFVPPPDFDHLAYDDRSDGSSSRSSSGHDEFEVVSKLQSAKSYMMEYSGLTTSEIAKIMADRNQKNNNKRIKIGNNEAEVVVVTAAAAVAPSKENQAEENNIDDEEEDDDDFVDVEMEADTQVMEVIIKPEEGAIEDDLFADVFTQESTSVDSIQSLHNKSPEAKSTTTASVVQVESLDKIIKERVGGDVPTKTATPVGPQIKMTVEQLNKVQTNLNRQQDELAAERSSKERLATNITDQMYQEAQELLQLFGVPYLIAPMEAEAQCAYLDENGLVDGTITDDSDIWLFGGKKVYKNFFNSNKQVMEFRSEDIQHHFKLSRQQMILLAMLVGSDYTVGLTGVGPVTALEILAAFPPSADDNLPLSGLAEFRSWFIKGKLPGPRRTTLRNKLKKLTIGHGFPNAQVAQAYLEPQVETSKDKFSWAKPDVVALTDFARVKFGWTRSKSEEILHPVVRRLEETITASQTSIKDYFQRVMPPPLIDDGKKISKRVKSALDKIGKPLEEDEDEPLAIRPQGTKQASSSRKRVKGSQVEVNKQETNSDAQSNKRKKVPLTTLLHKKEIITQKLKDNSDMMRNKLKAIETFRKSKQGPGYVKKKLKSANSDGVPSASNHYLSEESSDDD